MKEPFKRVDFVLYFSITNCLQADVWIYYVEDFSSRQAHLLKDALSVDVNAVVERKAVKRC